jgi:excinuclease UvrABC nuclease subunit
MSLSLKTVHKLPDAPGVYFFKKGSKILYIGKATSLRDRVKSYLSTDIGETRGPLIVKMVAEATAISHEKTDSVLEALILEAALIKKHQPLYNTKEKDNKSFNYVVITDEEYPRVFTIRERELIASSHKSRVTNHFLHTFGPFPNGTQLNDALKIIRKIFPFRGKTDAPLRDEKRKSRLYQEIGLAPDASAIGKKEYARTIRHLVLFFRGKKKELIKSIAREMKTYAKSREFEKATELRRQLFALQHINDVSLLKTNHSPIRANGRIEAYDVAHIGETNRIGVMTVVEDSEANRKEYRTFNIKQAKAGDTAALQEILSRRLNHNEWPLPKLIVVDGSTAQKNIAEKVLKEFGYQISVVAVTKNERHRPERILGGREDISGNERAILLANSEAHRFSLARHRKKRGKI